MLEELDVVRVKRAMPTAGIAIGAEGTIVHALTEPSTAYLVEFTDAEGRTLATEVFQPEDLEQVWSVRRGQHGQRQAA
ncbi:DUF4926 domain-containing protein [Sphaerotilus mobilis]|uniref:Uncharacterized protein DUF4926 n=1 Tax=Sphaerotilus mobilis TaxID=47994 RepID=A0A4Q7LI31_9BURK|nr:DUF4926 domain-containing protein [Sphaerotilus mobilis]RZS53019.1 uncharacterized protein DUF4926 [Sphaerotilus mobilis]